MADDDVPAGEESQTPGETPGDAAGETPGGAPGAAPQDPGASPQDPGASPQDAGEAPQDAEAAPQDSGTAPQNPAAPKPADARRHRRAAGLRGWLEGVVALARKRPWIPIAAAALVLALVVTAVVVLVRNRPEVPVAPTPTPTPTTATTTTTTAPASTTTTTPATPTTTTPTPTPTPARLVDTLTGLPANDQAAASKPVTAVMIENLPDARPQSGLVDAEVVFEAIAEAGITRFVCLYQQNQPTLLGPVRSARPYFIRWASAFDASLAHVGGSSQAKKMARSGNYVVDIDQMLNASGFWRAKDRAAPHNVYTTMANMLSRQTAVGKAASAFDAFPRQDAPAPGTAGPGEQAATNITFDISSASYAVNYRYDAASNTYKRFNGGRPQMDRERGQVAPSVVVAITVTEATQGDGREDINVTAGGTAYVFQHGTMVQGTWRKPSEKAQIQFLDATGKAIPLDRGSTWITAVPTGRPITWQ